MKLNHIWLDAYITDGIEGDRAILRIDKLVEWISGC